MRRFFIFAFALMASVALQAKGTTVKLTLTGPGLASPVDIVEPALLDGSNVWEGSFIGETIASVPRGTQPIYIVSFVVQTPEWMRQPARTMYTVQVAREGKSGALLLYLPGRGEAGYRLNVGTILRDGQDGHWHRPPHAWAAAITKYLP